MNDVFMSRGCYDWCYDGLGLLGFVVFCSRAINTFRTKKIELSHLSFIKQFYQVCQLLLVAQLTQTTTKSVSLLYRSQWDVHLCCRFIYLFIFFFFVRSPAISLGFTTFG